MASAITFGDANAGFQAGVVHGSVNTNFNLPPTPLIVIPFAQDVDFIERGVTLDQVAQRCAVPASRVALVGLGGVGKSQLAIEYAYRTRHQSPETWVFWVHASNAARFEQSFRDIADRVKIAGRDKAQTNIVKLVHDWLHDKKRKWLLILDNVDDARFLLDTQINRQGQADGSNNAARPLRDYLPNCEGGSILITSRNKEAALKLVEPRDVVPVDPMGNAQAQALLKTKLGTQGDDGHVAELAAALEYMPLAIVQAAAYISQRAPRCSIKWYLKKIQTSDAGKTSLLDYEAGLFRRDHEAKNSIIITWHISFSYLQQTQPSAADLLSLMSFFDRQGIPEALLRHQNVDDASLMLKTNSLEDDIETLRNFRFISANADGATFEMHRLVQLAMRKWLTTNGSLEEWKQKFIRILNRAFPTGEYENWATCQPLFPHVISAAALKPIRESSLLKWARLLNHAAWYARQIGNTADAATLAEQSMEVRKKVLGLKDKDTLISMSHLALTYSDQGRWDTAEELQVQVLEIYKRKLGKDHPDTLISMSNLASTYSEQGRWDAAEELQVQVLKIRKRKLGKDHPKTLISMGNLASTYSEQGRWDAAEELEVQVLKIHKKKLGKDHPDTLISMSNLASTYSEQGRCDAAEELQVQVLEIHKRKLGKDHPDTLTSMSHLAYTWKSQGQDLEALKLMRKCVQLRQHKLGAHHPHTLGSVKELAKWEAEQPVAGSGTG
ncbi:P-loop containing nucleoside triphosphate hydrolase protein [Phaeosphaeriaceae sp. PMI808]|nr:P-loop containing nucleoside triphosphate hydrolase protein [Phaeosphaeriaceae sp. PMI808]